MNWITVNEAVSLTGKTELTIRKLVKKHSKDSSFVKKDGGRVYLDFDKLSVIYPIKKDIKKVYDAENRSIEQKTSQMQIVSSSETIKELSEHIRQKDKQIEFLLTKKSKLPIWLTVGFVFSFIGALCGLWFAFNGYRNEQLKIHAKELAVLKGSLLREMDIREENSSKIESIHLRQISDLKNEIENLRKVKNKEYKVSGRTSLIP